MLLYRVVAIGHPRGFQISVRRFIGWLGWLGWLAFVRKRKKSRFIIAPKSWAFEHIIRFIVALFFEENVSVGQSVRLSEG